MIEFILGYCTGIVTTVLVIMIMMKPPKHQEFGDGCIELDESEFTMEVFRNNGEAMKVVPLSEYKKLLEENNAKD